MSFNKVQKLKQKLFFCVTSINSFYTFGLYTNHPLSFPFVFKILSGHLATMACFGKFCNIGQLIYGVVCKNNEVDSACSLIYPTFCDVVRKKLIRAFFKILTKVIN